MRYKDYMEDPIAMVKQVYDYFGYEYTQEFEDRFFCFFVSFSLFSFFSFSFPLQISLFVFFSSFLLSSFLLTSRMKWFLENNTQFKFGNYQHLLAYEPYGYTREDLEKIFGNYIKQYNL